MEIQREISRGTRKRARTATHNSPTASANQNDGGKVCPRTAAAAIPIPDIEDFVPGDAREIGASLLRWYDQSKRDLPWRTVQSPADAEARAYGVWVSEIMLQQTRVAAVVEYYNRWMARWPTVHSLAAASIEEVNEMWAGLGYYRRARFLLEGARRIVEKGEFPRTAAALLDVPGIGQYTAGAIASIAFNEPVPVVDGNVIRVIARLKAISSNPKESATVKTIWKLAGQLVDSDRPGDFNQALMELGATLCTPSSPDCSNCPVYNYCRALSISKSNESAKVTDYPVKIEKPKQRLEYAAVCIVEIATIPDKGKAGHGTHNNAFLLVKRPDEGLLAGLWEFPSVWVNQDEVDQKSRRKAINNYLRVSFNLQPEVNCSLIYRGEIGTYIHVFSHIRLHMYVELLILSPKEGELDLVCASTDGSTFIWKYVEEASVRSMGLTSSVRKVYNMMHNFKNKLPLLSTVAPKKKRSKKLV